jgi:hypothetical protein
LNRALAVARKFDLGGGAFTFVKKSAGASLSPLYCVALAMLGFEVKGSMVLPEPDIFGMG